jgi:hypothetical protein
MLGALWITDDAAQCGHGTNKRKRPPKTVLKLPDPEQSKSAVLNSSTSASSQRTYDHAIREFIEWNRLGPRLAFNKVVVTRYRISLEQGHYASSTINLRLAAVRRLAYVLRRTCAKLSHEARGELEQIQFLLGHFTGVIGATEA